MTIRLAHARQSLQAFDFRHLFISDIGGWNHARLAVPDVNVEGKSYTFVAIAGQGGLVVAECVVDTDDAEGRLPPLTIRKKLSRYFDDFSHEHLLIFTDRGRNTSVWTWPKHEDGKVTIREETYQKGHAGDRLLGKLAGLVFQWDELDDEGQASITEVTAKVSKAFDVEKVTKRFYQAFEAEHDQFMAFLSGLHEESDRAWYTSVMLNRLMFLYFIQKKGFLDGDTDYLQSRLAHSQQRGVDHYYNDFLKVLFFEGLASGERERSAATNKLLGKVPYLNGGIFQPHQIEEGNAGIDIPDAAFERLFKFFDKYTWHLDDRPLHNDNEINPDVLGYIFEKYINQKQMGAYYTKEDITEYICKYTILPFLLEKVGVDVTEVLTSIDPYIYDAVKTPEYLPTETEREYIARQKRYEQIGVDFASGKIATVNDLITWNLDIRAFAQDWLQRTSPQKVRTFYAALTALTVLDPTCGSGAFLFAAMNILEPLYEECLRRMRETTAGPDGARYADFAGELARMAEHANERYFIFKSIIIANLYGVDIMKEAVEICKLRLFLKLVAQVNDYDRIEPLPDIDFNIRAGNTLVGFATRAEIEGNMFARPTLPQIETMTGTLAKFRRQQLETGIPVGTLKTLKENIRRVQSEIADTLDKALNYEYGGDDRRLPAFRASHQPFHWYAEFNGVMARSGFDIIVGNPPYAELRSLTGYSVEQYKTAVTRNLYPVVIERCLPLSQSFGRTGVIVPVSSVATEGYKSLQDLVFAHSGHFSSYDDRPSKLFEGLEHIQLTIHLIQKRVAGQPVQFSTECFRWNAQERDFLFEVIQYQSIKNRYLQGCIPKISSSTEQLILDHIWNGQLPIGQQTNRRGEHVVYYSRKVHNFLQVLNFVPQVSMEKVIFAHQQSLRS